MTLEQALQQAVAHHKAGQLQDAERLYRAILQAQPNHPDANHNLGVLAVQLKQADASLAHFKAALETDPNQGQYWLSYIDALIQTGKSDAARQVLEQGRQRGLPGDALEALAGRLEGVGVVEHSSAEHQDAEKESLPGAPTGLENSKKKTRTKLTRPDKSARKFAPCGPVSPSPQEINTLAVLFTQQRYAEIEPLARAMTLRYPLHGFGWKVLGAVFSQMGRSADALASKQKAAALLPDDADVHNNLGNSFNELGRLDEAAACFRRALQIRPAFAQAHSTLGTTLQKMDRLEEAVACFQRALQIKPDYAEAHSNLGNALKEMGQMDAAVASYRRALQIKPDYAEAHNNLGGAHKEMDQLEEAEASYRRALQLKPDYAEAHYNLGNTLKDLDQLEEAEASYRRALQIKPDYAEAQSNLGDALKEMGQMDAAVASYRRALQIKPDLAVAHSNLGNVLKELGQMDAAGASYRRALQIKPDCSETHNNFAIVLQEMGLLDEAVASYRRALQIKPGSAFAQSNLLSCLDYNPDLGAEEIYRDYQEHDLRYGVPLRSAWRTYSNEPSPHRRLRVGYVSPDFRYHACHLYVEPLLAHHDKTQLEVYAYAELVREDQVSARYKSYVEHWIPTKGLSDEALAERIRSDGIDILVDLAGHTANNRLSVFARKPAPVSLSWIIGSGYTTGLSAIDYILADEALMPMGSEGVFAEQAWRLSSPAYSYRPNVGMGQVNELPARQRGHITFGVLTRSIRINHRTIRLWSELLKAVPTARLVIDSYSYKDAAMQERLASNFAAHGIARERLEIGARYAHPWEALRGIDISLDCFPNNVGTSLLVSLYMGVPFITLAGRPSLGRFGSHNLQGVGHPEWIAKSEEEYLAKAVALASDFDRLAGYRATLRTKMEESPLLDEANFARKVEEAYRQMWQRWCATQTQATR